MWKILQRQDLSTIASPVRREVLEALSEPDSAANLARRLNTSRQRIGYHMRALERAGFLELVEERQQRGCTEQFYRAKRITYVLEPNAFGSDINEESETLRKQRDRYSWSALLSMAVRMIQDLTSLRKRADKADKRLATLALDTSITFANPAVRKEFTNEVTVALENIVRKYNNPNFKNGRRYRVVLGAYPFVKPAGTARSEQ